MAGRAWRIALPATRRCTLFPRGRPRRGPLHRLVRPVAHYVERANGREKVMEWHGGDVTGVLPYSRVAASPGDSIVEIPSEIAVIRREDLPAFTSALVHVMLDRARHFTSNDLLADKMASLGKLSAGLAHELNNPASAIARSAKSLTDALMESEDASFSLGALALTGEQRSAIEDVRAVASRPPAQPIDLQGKWKSS